jgi:hypothetical protein
MKKSEVRMGDRVRAVAGIFCDADVGEDNIGTVVVIEYHGNVGVQFDREFREGHTCDGSPPNYPRFKSGHCRWGNVGELEFVSHGEFLAPEGYDPIGG